MIPPPRSLKEKWLKLAEQQMQWSRESDAKGDGANSHTERARARIYRECAADLDALLAAEGRHETDHGASLGSQQAGSSVETVAHPTLGIGLSHE